MSFKPGRLTMHINPTAFSELSLDTPDTDSENSNTNSRSTPCEDQYTPKQGK